MQHANGIMEGKLIDDGDVLCTKPRDLHPTKLVLLQINVNAESLMNHHAEGIPREMMAAKIFCLDALELLLQ